MLDQLTRALSALAPRGEFSVIPLYNPRRGADAQVFLHGDHARESVGAAQLSAVREALAVLPEVADVGTRRDHSLSVRFADARVGSLGERLESGDLVVLDARDILAGEELVVNFCDANPTKALHVGHLRNIALGQALAAALTAAGARVTRQSQVSDYCRSMGEALAGYLELPAHLTPRTLGVKSDHFVGECFMRYARTPADTPAGGDGSGEGPWEADEGGVAPQGGRPGEPAQGDRAGATSRKDGAEPALSAEEQVRNDLADKLLARWSAGDPEIRARWEKLRGWALEGQDATLAALGVRLERMVYESDSRPLTQWILDTGLASGALTRADGGAVVFETGDEEYPRLLLARADGFPTQHLRTFALWHSLRGSLGATRTIELVGEEWHAYVRYHERLMGHIESSPETAREAVESSQEAGRGAVESSQEAGRGPVESSQEAGRGPVESPQEAGRGRVESPQEAGRGPVESPQGAPPRVESPGAPARGGSLMREQRHPTSNVIYGMVTVAGGAVKSSNGRPPLVDGLLERLAVSQELQELAAQSGGRLTPRSLAALIALGLYLGRPTRKPVDLTLTEMLELRGGIGWELARAAAHAWSPRHDGPPDPAPEDPRYRQIVLQSQFHRQLLTRAVEQLDVYELARFYGHLSRRYLATPADGRVARAMRTLLAAGLGALGLPGAPADGGAGR